MATQPKDHTPANAKNPPAARAEAEEAEHSKPAPAADAPVRTIADEQRERSAEMEREGVDAWKAAHDERDGDDKKQVAGVGQPAGAKGATPEARSAQHPAAPR